MTRTFEKISSEKNVALRRKLILNLPRKNSPSCYAVFVEIIKNDPSPVIRHEVAFILGTIKDPRSVDILIDAIIHDHSDLVRHEAIEAIGDIGIRNKKIDTLLKNLSKDSNPFIKDTAEVALATLKIN